MVPIWLIVGIIMTLMGIFDRQVLRFLGYKRMSEVIAAPNLMHSSEMIERIGRWLMIMIGVSFLVLGLGGVLPDNVGNTISYALLGLSGLMLITIIVITVANRKAR